MDIELTQMLCALAAFVIPMGVAWLIVARNEHRNPPGQRCEDTHPVLKDYKKHPSRNIK